MVAPKKPQKQVETMVAQVQGVGEIPVVDVKDAKPEKIKEALYDEEIQLSVYGVRVVPVDPRAGLVVVDNVGEGDLYVGTNPSNFGEALAPGGSTEIRDAAVFYLRASSRPTARVRMFGK